MSAALDAGRKGASSAGVHKVVIGRPARMHGHEIAAAMGVNTWAAFAGSDEQAVVDGDMTGEEPRIVFLHYWGVGRTDDLARALRAALDQTRHEPAGK